MSQKRFRTGHLNDIVKQEHRTWLIFPIIMGVLLFRYGWEIFAVSKTQMMLSNALGFLVIIFLIALVFGCIPFYIRRAKLLGAKKELLSNCTFVTMQDLDYYRDKLTGLTPGEISLLEDLQIEEEKDLSAYILWYEHLGLIRETEDGYIQGNPKPGENEKLRESDYFLIDKLLEGTAQKHLPEWKEQMMAEAVADGFLKKRSGILPSAIDRHAKKIAFLWVILLIACIFLIASGTMEPAMQEAYGNIAFPLSDQVFWFGRKLNWMLACMNTISGKANEVELILRTPQLLSTMALCFMVFALFFLLLLVPFLYLKMRSSQMLERADYVRTARGNEYAEYIWGMKNFIHDYSYLNEAEKDALALWDDYLIYAVLLEEKYADTKRDHGADETVKIEERKEENKMDGAVIVKVVIMALILVLVIVTICTCNKFMVLKTRAENQASQIDIQLARRADLIPNLVEIVKGYAKHEKETLMTVVELRNRMTLADTRNERFEANEALNRASRKVFAVAEQYPELKANTNFLQLQTELSETEDRVSKARQFYNDAATKYNIELQMFPKSILAKIFHLSKLSLLEFGKMENPGIHF